MKTVPVVGLVLSSFLSGVLIGAANGNGWYIGAVLVAAAGVTFAALCEPEQ